MLRTVQFACTLPKAEADALNAESGRVYTDMLVQHYRRFRKQGIWLSPTSGERLEDAVGGPTMLHAHSRDAAQQGFYKACKTAKACRALGLAAHYPHKRKRFRTTIWKHTGIRKQAGLLLLARARGLSPVKVALPAHLGQLPVSAFLEARLVWDRAARHYAWHVVIEDGKAPRETSGDVVVAADLGEIHPAAATDGKHTVIIACRAMRANQQYTAKRLAQLRQTGPQAEGFSAVETPRAAQDALSGEAAPPRPRPGTQKQPCGGFLGFGARGCHAGDRGCP